MKNLLKLIVLSKLFLVLSACGDGTLIKFTKPENVYLNKRALSNQVVVENTQKTSLEKENSHLSPETLSYYKELGSEN